MNQALLFITAVLAVYRVAHFIASEDGPFMVLTQWRGWLYERVGHESWIYQGFTCILCLSFWFSWLAAVFVPGNYALNALGIAGGVLVIHKAIYR